MFEYSIHGSLINSDIELFQARIPPSTVGRGHTLHLLEKEPDKRPNTDNHIVRNLPESHGRKLTLSSAASSPETFTNQPWRFDVDGIVRFQGNGQDDHIYYTLRRAGEPRQVAFWFVHILLPLFLTVEKGYFFLHAAAVEVNNRAVVLLAPSHGGKSTLADFFLKKGHRLISDDKLALWESNERFLAVPSYPYHRPYRSEEDLGLQAPRFVDENLEIGGVYPLGRNDYSEKVNTKVLSGLEGFKLLKQHSLHELAIFERARLGLLTRLIESTPIVSIERPWGMEYLDVVYEKIMGLQNTPWLKDE